MQSDIEEFVKSLYSTDRYIIQNPSLHEEDSPWKISKILPLVDKFIGEVNKEKINILDVGGGAGFILKAVSTYIESHHHARVDKFVLDLSPGMLEIQKKNNSDLKRAFNEDMRKTSIGNKEIDLVLLIDVLEHVSDTTVALEELRRISNFVIFKVPLEDNLCTKTWNFINRGKPRKRSIENLGHINYYNFRKLKQQIEKHLGCILDSYFTNYYQYLRDSEHYREDRNLAGKLADLVGLNVYKLSPRICSEIFTDFTMMLAKCY